ncbi:MAG: hypothetical protein RL238_2045 [Actinomycetota bacterium]|jgi:hypothetical protein
MAGKWDLVRQRAETLGVDAKQRWVSASEAKTSVNVAEALYRRDALAFGSVLGSAIALRMFLFIIPANVTIIALSRVIHFSNAFDDTFSSSPTTGPMATALFGISRWQALGVMLSSAVITLWAGRSLARVLSVSSGAAWGLTINEAKQKMKSMGALIGVFFVSVAANIVFTAIRDHTGIALGFVVWVTVFACFSVMWFVVMITLPRTTSDPGALLPGAALFGLGYAALQWFMQYYLPLRIERTSDTMGQTATTVAVLGNFFFVGRLMSGSFVFTAVIYERFGSLSHVVFGLPVVRRLPQRYPRIATYFALDGAPEPEVEPATEAAEPR